MKELENNKKDISLIINCNKEDIENIDINYFKSQYSKIYFNINNNLDKIINIIETEYYSIWDYNKEYKNINNLKEISINKSYIENPDISVIVCLYNTKPELFKDCITGLINQIFKNFEVLIVNDGSDKYYNENKQLINSLHDNRFIWINKEHSGKSQTLNLGIEKSRGKYIAINDSDDISFPNRLEYQYNWLEENIEYDLISNAFINSIDKKYNYNINSQDITSETLHYLCIHPSQMFNKKNVLSKVPFLFESIYDSMEDAVFNHIMFYHNIKMYYSNNILLYYNSIINGIHIQNYTGIKYHMSNNLFFKTFNIDNNINLSLCNIIIANHSWEDELEKTILNIKLTSSNQCPLYILIYNNNNYYNINNFKQYNCQVIILNTYNECIKYIQTNLNIFDYYFIISNPIRFYNKNWDIDLYDHMKYLPHNINLLQPKIFNIQKNNTNIDFNDKTNVAKIYKIIRLKQELLKEIHIPKNIINYAVIDNMVISSELIFIISKQLLNEINFDILKNEILYNAYISLHSSHIYYSNFLNIGYISIFNCNNVLNNFYICNKNIILNKYASIK